jgi:5,10-methylenetetrahydromethanopterin reductase
MAASGPKAIELAREVADGALLLIGFHRGIVERAMELLDRGARRSGRRAEDLEVIWAVRTGVAPTMEEARRMGRPITVHMGVMRWGGAWLDATGIKLPHFQVPDAVHRIYPDLSHARDWDAAITATSFVPDDVIAELSDALGLIGTPEHCADRIVEMRKAGVKSLYLMGFQTFAAPEPELRAFRDVVFPRLRAAGLR